MPNQNRSATIGVEFNQYGRNYTCLYTDNDGVPKGVGVSFDSPTNFWDAVIEPVNLLTSDVATNLLISGHMEDRFKFEEAVEDFVAASKTSGISLPLSVPPIQELSNHVYSLLVDCPYIPGTQEKFKPYQRLNTIAFLD